MIEFLVITMGYQTSIRHPRDHGENLHRTGPIDHGKRGRIGTPHTEHSFGRRELGPRPGRRQRYLDPEFLGGDHGHKRGSTRGDDGSAIETTSQLLDPTPRAAISNPLPWVSRGARKAVPHSPQRNGGQPGLVGIRARGEMQRKDDSHRGVPNPPRRQTATGPISRKNRRTSDYWIWANDRLGTGTDLRCATIRYIDWTKNESVRCIWSDPPSAKNCSRPLRTIGFSVSNTSQSLVGSDLGSWGHEDSKKGESPNPSSFAGGPAKQKKAPLLSTVGVKWGMCPTLGPGGSLKCHKAPRASASRQMFLRRHQ